MRLASRPARAVRRWWAGRTLRWRLLAGVIVLLVIACTAIGVATVVALQGFLVDRVDQQLAQAGPRLALSLEHPAPSGGTGTDGGPAPYDAGPDMGGLRGQQAGTLGARLVSGQLAGAGVVRLDEGQVSLVDPHLDAADVRTLAQLPADGTPDTVTLSRLGSYRVSVVSGADGDLLVTGLPLTDVAATLHRLELIEVSVFLAALIVIGMAGAGWIRLTLRPLHRVARTAAEVSRMPLASGEVRLPAVSRADPRTEVGQLSTAFQQMLAHVEQSLAARNATEARLRQFIADASHELRTPLAAIRGHAELARRRPNQQSGEVRHALERVEAESSRMGVLVDDLLLLARLDAGRPLACEPVDVTRLVLDATSDARVAGRTHQWRLELPDEPVEVIGDEHRLHQVVANLLTNARTHTPPGTTATVQLSAVQRDGRPRVRIAVVDDGPGIPPELRDKVFERFVRADAARTRETGSSGLGLAIVAAVVAAHGGSVNVRSEPGRTEFEVLLPAATAETPAEPAAEPASAQASDRASEGRQRTIAGAAQSARRR